MIARSGSAVRYPNGRLSAPSEPPSSRQPERQTLSVESDYPSGESILLRYLKWPTDLHYAMSATVVTDDSDGTWLTAPAGTPIDHGPKGVLPARAKSVVFVPRSRPWTARWYDAADRGRGGRVDSYSCYIDITSPPSRSRTAIEVVDLDLDVVLTWEGEIRVLDEDEFVENASKRGYPTHLVAEARSALREAESLLRTTSTPFDGRHVSHLARLRRADARLPDS